jgi:hypothetical protein
MGGVAAPPEPLGKGFAPVRKTRAKVGKDASMRSTFSPLELPQ